VLSSSASKWCSAAIWAGGRAGHLGAPAAHADDLAHPRLADGADEAVGDPRVLSHRIVGPDVGGLGDHRQDRRSAAKDAGEERLVLERPGPYVGTACAKCLEVGCGPGDGPHRVPGGQQPLGDLLADLPGGAGDDDHALLAHGDVLSVGCWLGMEAS
jgi:hypothetical protein